MTFLDELVAGARQRVTDAAARESPDSLQIRAAAVAAPPSLVAALDGDGVAVIAEVKRASPSRGTLAPGVDAARLAGAYRDGGAAAVSVLTEPDRFQGSLDDLTDASGAGLPTVRKDFIVDRRQVWEARAAGAAAVLLIVAALDDATLASLATEAATAGLDTLVEVHDRGELERAAAIGARIVGVNARDLRTFEVDRDAFARLAPLIPDGALAVCESGVRDPDDVREAAAHGADAVLVGESLVTAADPSAAVTALVDAGRRPAAPQDAGREAS